MEFHETLVLLFTDDKDPVIYINAKEMAGPFASWKMGRCPVVMEGNEDMYDLGKQCFRKMAIAVANDDLYDNNNSVSSITSFSPTVFFRWWMFTIIISTSKPRRTTEGSKSLTRKGTMMKILQTRKRMRNIHQMSMTAKLSLMRMTMNQHKVDQAMKISPRYFFT